MQNLICKFTSVVLFFCFLISCNNPAGNFASSKNVSKTTDGYFKGVLEFKISNLLISDKMHYKLLELAIDGESIKQEVNEYYLTKLSKTYGIVYTKGSDSVKYYAKIDNKINYTIITKTQFLEWVANLQAPKDVEDGTALADDKPFSYVFMALPEQNLYTVSNTNAADYMDFKNCKQMNIAFEKEQTCNVIYSNDIKVPAIVLKMTEHKQPAALNTIALQVNYPSKSKPVSDAPAWKKLLNKVIETGSKIANYSSTLKSSRNLEAKDLELPADATYMSIMDLNNLTNPPVPEGSGGSSSHSFDFD